MTDEAVRHVKRGRHYKAPLILNHGSAIKLVFLVLLLMGMIFIWGYQLGKQAPGHALTGLESDGHIPVRNVSGQGLVKAEPGPAVLDQVTSHRHADELVIEVTASAVSVLPPDSGDHLDKPKPVSSASSVESLQNRAGLNREAGVSTAAEKLETSVTKELLEAEVVSNSQRDAHYTVQVGMFSVLDNAQRKIDSLITSGFDAYSHEYTNAQQLTRFNVRFGHFSDRKSAMLALTRYQKEFAGSGYIVALSPAVEDSRVVGNDVSLVSQDRK